MKYEIDNESQKIINDIIIKLNLDHIHTDKILCLKSRGSKSKRTLARIHGLPKVMQIAFNTKAFYVIELISENFDKLDQKEKIRTLIHELMHIPKNFGGGFRQHRPYVTSKKVDNVFKEYMKL